MTLPNASRAVVDIAKLRDYCLNPHHPRGRHKARVFQSALGFTQLDAERFREILLNQSEVGEATPTLSDSHGQRYELDFELAGRTGPVRIRSCWIIRADEDFPRLSTCFVV